MGVNDVEAADVVLDREELVDEGPAHVVDFIDEIGVEHEVAAVIVNAVDAVVVRLLRAAAGEHVDFVTATVESGGQLRDVDADAAHGDAVQRLP